MQSFRIATCLVIALLVAPLLSAQNFRNPYRIPTTQDPVSIFVADLNGDGIPDLLYETERAAQEAGAMMTFFGHASGGYVAGPSFPLQTDIGGCRLVDVNRDGILDLACLYLLDTFDIQVAVYFGNGDGTFQTTAIFSPPIQSNVGADHGFIAWLFAPVDVNGDGIPDLLVGDALDDWTFVLVGDGAGHFTIASKLTGIASTADARDFVLDLNGDGKTDLVSSSGPSVWLGNGDGTFQSTTPYGTYNSCILQDMDGDGHLDAVCEILDANGSVDAGTTKLAILHGNADGSFNPTPIATKIFGNPAGGYGAFISPIGVRDVNGDGIPDILAYSSDGFTVLLGQPNLNFADPVHYATGFRYGYGQPSGQLVDINNDGFIDLVSTGPNGIYISYGKSDGTFSTAPAIPVAQVVGHITAADFNGDGIPDIVASGDQSLELSLGKGDGTFQPFTTIPNGDLTFVSGSASQVLHGDFRGNGKQDLLAYATPDGNIYDFYWLAGNGDGTFSSPQSTNFVIVNSPNYFPMEVLDINKDGKDDVVSRDSSNFYVSLSKGDGTFTSVSTPISVPLGSLGFTLPAFADFNGDGKLDALYALGPNLYLLPGNGDGTFNTPLTVLNIPPFQGQPQVIPLAVVTGDFDGDGKSDCAVLVQISDMVAPWTNQTISVAYVYYGNGDGTFSSPVVAGEFNRLYNVMVTADLNKDGLTDLVLQTNDSLGSDVSPSGDALGVVLSAPQRFFGAETSYTGGGFESSLVMADLNGDGFPDILSVNGGFYSNGDSITQPGSSVTSLLNLGPQAASGTSATSTALSVSNYTVLAGTPLTLTAYVAPSASASAFPTGTIRFTDQTGVSSVVPVSSIGSDQATASFTSSAIGIGADVISASYSGDSNFAPSTGYINVTVNGYPYDASFTVAPNTLVAGQMATLGVSITNPPGSSAPTPTGFVVFLDNSKVLSGASTLASGSTSYNFALSSSGQHVFSAYYSGDANHAPSTQTVTATAMDAVPTLSLFAPTGVTTAQPLTIEVSIRGGSGNPLPTGAITVSGSGFTSQPAAISNGSVTLTIPAGALAVGTDALTATYTPDAAASVFYTGASASTFVQINPAPPGFTITGTSITVTRGATTGNTSTISIAPVGGFTGNIGLTASFATTPLHALSLPTLSFGGSEAVNITGTNPATATLTVVTIAPSTSSVAVSPQPKLRWAAVSGSTLAGFLLLGFRVRSRAKASLLGLIVFLSLVAGGMEGCGGGTSSSAESGGGGGTTNPGTTPGTYTVTVNATSGSINETCTVTVTVQ